MTDEQIKDAIDKLLLDHQLDVAGLEIHDAKKQLQNFQDHVRKALIAAYRLGSKVAAEDVWEEWDR